MICNNGYLANILRVCEIKDLILMMRFQSPYVYFDQNGGLFIDLAELKRGLFGRTSVLYHI